MLCIDLSRRCHLNCNYFTACPKSLIDLSMSPRKGPVQELANVTDEVSYMHQCLKTFKKSSIKSLPLIFLLCGNYHAHLALYTPMYVLAYLSVMGHCCCATLNSLCLLIVCVGTSFSYLSHNLFTFGIDYEVGFHYEHRKLCPCVTPGPSSCWPLMTEETSYSLSY
jgi:hypothetical protein